MRILLIGEYSNVHWTLAQGLRSLGHEVTVASGGDSWKGYPRDIDLAHTLTLEGHISFAWRLLRALPKMCGYDIVQLINPVFLELSPWPHHLIFDFLQRNNRKVVLGAFGMDHYWVKVNRDLRPMRYSDFNIGAKVRTDAVAQKDVDIWIGTEAERLCRYVAHKADAIVAGLYEYWLTYQLAEEGRLKSKTSFISFPIPAESAVMEDRGASDEGPLKVFVGVSKGRSQYKGTDIMLKAARRLEQEYPDKMRLLVAEGVPFEQYQSMMNGSDVILDQLYSYTPAMNALLAMGKGIICVGGGEPEHYELLGESELRPIINVEPNEQSVYQALKSLVLCSEHIQELKRQSVEYVRRHHAVDKVAKKYVCLYERLLRAEG